jgi:hypothetical protein
MAGLDPAMTRVFWDSRVINSVGWYNCANQCVRNMHWPRNSCTIGRQSRRTPVSDPIEPYLLVLIPVLFLVLFLALWFAVTTLIGAVSGWYALMRRYPDRDEKPVLALSWQSGRMGMARLRGVLTLSACPSGLRVGMIRAFGVFARDFFVPWDDIAVSKKTWLFAEVAELSFGKPPVGTLTLLQSTAARLAAAAPAFKRKLA